MVQSHGIAAYVQPSRRPADGRYGDNPNRLFQHHQFQVVMKPSPANIQELYLGSLEALGIKPLEHDIRFVEDNWENPSMGAAGIGWEVWLDGMEVTQFTYFQQVGGIEVDSVTAEVTYGLERLASYIQDVPTVYDFRMGKWGFYAFEESDQAMLLRHFDEFEAEATRLLALGLVHPAYDYILKSSHTFNLLDARGTVSVTERAGYLHRIRTMARKVSKVFIEERAKLGFPLLKDEQLRDKYLGENEIGLEEIPAHLVTSSENQLIERTKKFLSEHRLTVGDIKPYSTPRRLAVVLTDVAETSESLSEEKRDRLLTVHKTKTGANVVVDATVRKNEIRSQLNAIAEANGWVLQLETDAAQDLLEEVNNIVEWPTAFAGSFDEKYLEIPDEVLITSMREHQRFFFVTNEKGQLLPHFLSIRNGNREHLNNVIAGNEKVLVARLEDAEFFYHEDQTKSISDYMTKVKKLVFHEKIGTVYEHMQRTGALASAMAAALKFDEAQQADLSRASEIYKFDLMTGMVGEFDELQGIMGEHYAKLFGEDDAVATAIREHYMPTSANGEVARSEIGALLAVADKLDSIVTFFAAGLIPSGSNDPYGLRRAATGIVRTLVDKKWHIDLLPLLADFVQQQGKVTDTDLTTVVDFMLDRVRKLSLDAGIRQDIVTAGLGNVDMADIVYISQRVEVLSQHSGDDRLAVKQVTNTTVDPTKFENQSEKELYQATLTLDLNTLMHDGAENLYMALANLQQPIAAYFDETMVNAEDESVKDNRYAQLNVIQRLTNGLGDLTQIVIKVTRVVTPTLGKRPTEQAELEATGTIFTTDIEDIVTDDSLDLVVVVTPSQSHYQVTKQLLQAGKNVLVDKPMAASVEEAEELVKLATENNLFLMPFQSRRFDSDFLTVQQVISNGYLGRLTDLEVHMDHYRPLDGQLEGAAIDGSLFGHGVHLIDQVVSLFGSPQAAVYDLRATRVLESHLDDQIEVNLFYPEAF
ncbi:hypothetical protein Pfo_031483 [Paulownia fortunei]|nr:hypothetical protein Pfo_031483 [Paulownia fortunei]